MKTIRTRYYGPTNYKGSCYRATDGDNTIRVSTNFEVNNEQNHGLAALALCAKLGWTGKMKAGGFKDDMYWVFEDSDWQIITAHNVSPVAVKGGK